MKHTTDDLHAITATTLGHYNAVAESFRDGTRESGTMMAAARTLSDEEITDLARHFGRSAAVAADIEQAPDIIRLGIPEHDVPACAACHGASARPGYPRLDGQDADYLLRQLELFKLLGAERGGPNAHIMAEAVRELDQDQIKSLAEWYGAGAVTRTPAELPLHP